MISAGIGVKEELTVQMVDCSNEPDPEVSTPLPPAPEGASPVTSAAEATIEHTGADPPPDEVR